MTPSPPCDRVERGGCENRPQYGDISCSTWFQVPGLFICMKRLLFFLLFNGNRVPRMAEEPVIVELPNAPISANTNENISLNSCTWLTMQNIPLFFGFILPLFLSSLVLIKLSSAQHHSLCGSSVFGGRYFGNTSDCRRLFYFIFRGHLFVLFLGLSGIDKGNA